jgi:hypothetical protein
MLNLLPAFNPNGGDDGAKPRRASTKVPPGGGVGTAAAAAAGVPGGNSLSQKEWDPSASVAHEGKVPLYLDIQPTARGKRDTAPRPPPKVDLAQEKQMMLPPNERYLPQVSVYTAKDPSPLSVVARGTAEDATIVVPDDLQAQPKDAATSAPRRARSPSSSGNLCLAVRTTNMTEEPLSVFVQKLSSTMDVATVDPGRCVTNVLRGTSGGSASDRARETMHCVAVRTMEAVVQFNSHQELLVVQFECRPLGLELEMRDDKIFCARVLEDSQAWGHEETLVGAEIIAIDDQRIATLEDFQFIVTALRMRGVGPRVQFVRTVAAHHRAASRGGRQQARAGPSGGGANHQASSSSSRNTRVVDGDGDGMVASMTRVAAADTAAPLSWAYATSFGMEEEVEEVVDGDAEPELGPKHLVLAPPNASIKVHTDTHTHTHTYDTIITLLLHFSSATDRGGEHRPHWRNLPTCPLAGQRWKCTGWTSAGTSSSGKRCASATATAN